VIERPPPTKSKKLLEGFVIPGEEENREELREIGEYWQKGVGWARIGTR
jgi:hypothetical protein